MPNLNFLIADDHFITRKGLKILIRDIYPNAEIEEAKDADEVLKLARAKNFDIYILDLNMPKTTGVDLIGRVIRLRPDARILIMSMNNEAIYSTRVVEEGAKGYISKEVEFSRVKDAISKVLADGIYLSDQMINTLIDRKQTQNYTQNPFSVLSSKELEIAKLVHGGKSIKEIMVILNKSQSTISTQKANVFAKLGIENSSDFYEMAKLYNLQDLTV